MHADFMKSQMQVHIYLLQKCIIAQHCLVLIVSLLMAYVSAVCMLQVVLFFLEKQGELAQRLSAIRQKVPNFGPDITDITAISSTISSTISQQHGGLQTINSSVSLAEEGSSNFNNLKKLEYETELNSNINSINAVPTAHGLPYLTHNELDELSRQYTAVGQDLVKLLRFLQLNVTGLRKVS
jgi:hypothetical protein